MVSTRSREQATPATTEPAPIRGARNPGTPFEPEWVRGGPRQPERGGATGRHPGHPSQREEGVAGGLAPQGGLVHRSHHARRRRHSRTRAQVVRESSPAGPTGYSRGASVSDLSVLPPARSVSTTPWSRQPSRALQGSGIPVAAVSTGFPAGLSPFAQRVAEIGASVAAGAAEIDIVITRAHVLAGRTGRPSTTR